MAAVRYLGFSITWFRAIGRLGLRFPIIVPNLVQKCWSTPKLWPKSVPSWISENLISKHWIPLRCRFYMIVPNLVQKCWRRNYGRKSKSKMAAVRHLVFSKNWFLNTVTLGSRFSINIPNLVRKCWSTPKLWPNIEIQDGGRPTF